MQTRDITYRRARNTDSRVIIKILKKTFEEYDLDLPENYSFADIENLEEEYLNSNGEFIVLLRNQNIIGFFALLPSNKNRIELKRLYLTAKERGKGFGKYLLKLALEIAKESGFSRIHLETTSKFVEAVGLYRKIGFISNTGGKLSPGHDIGLAMDL